MGNPMEPLYNGGIIWNGEFNNGLLGWSAPWGVEATVRTSPSGNKFAAALRRGAKPSHSVIQKIQMQSNTHYALSGTGADAALDILVDSVSLQPFTADEWNAQRTFSADRARKSSTPELHITLHINRSRAGFPFGNAMSKEILDVPAYERWFTSRFMVTTFEDEMKWYSTERVQNHEDYRVPDAMLPLAQRHGIKVRGHVVLWDDQRRQMGWVKPLDPGQLQAAMRKRIRSVVSRYAGKVIAWDVVNENLHYNFFESRLGPDASPEIYQQVAQLDGAAMLFMNEFKTLEQPMDTAALPAKYAAKMNRIRSYAGGNAAGLRVSIGLESHFSTPNIPYMRATLDTLAQLGIPIWLTEVDVTGGPMQARYLERY
ncbi:Anti-sigma-I factor RsgI6 [Dichanthelium oligosanthes]|uniref:Anti-sigma-I factor RsgI6 n=1 Tax=Dichanthelium oligosanthes TaxID=888268 RepID=A0A1E5UQL1_9POAL|nr:Anti-sigma-I factor RsgI6 [Dichanthelium oligosanthes]